jgi:D-alanyl-lipoteichoic acid acyltransferase DltB (MBOAT superfamily)
MSFTSWDFIVAFPLLLAVLQLVRGHQWQNAILLVFSWYFYSFNNWRLIFLLWGFSVFAWAVALAIERARTQPRRKLILTFGLTIVMLTLGTFKYLDFAIDIANDVARLTGADAILHHANISLPLGISFYAFQCSAYLIDVYRGEFPAVRSFFLFALFKAFFPQLVAGPIERAHNLMPQLAADRRPGRQDFSDGIFFLGVGYFLKVVVADTLDPMVAFAFEGAGQPGVSGATVLLGVLGFGLQIYGDFAGYSLIAVGLARMLGVKLTMNFNGPYLAQSPADFWRRWHITLSQWLRDYLYIPLGGNRRGKSRTHVNLMITMALGGLWHGAAWNFVIWGIYHGLWLAIGRAVGWDGTSDRWAGRLARGAATFAVVHFGWMLFRVSSVDQAIRILHAVAFDFVVDGQTLIYARIYFPLLALVMAEQALSVYRARGGTGLLVRSSELNALVGALAAAMVVAFGFSGTPFIYFRF